MDAQTLSEILGVSVFQRRQTRSWTFHEFSLSSSPFARGELKVRRTGNEALLVLDSRESESLTYDELSLARYGEPVSIRSNPSIPPEGADAYGYDIRGVRVYFEFRHVSQRLRTISFEWR
jgi:hypothetical protein